MKLRRKLIALVDVLAAEAERNEDFRTRLESALGLASAPAPTIGRGESAPTPRKGGRRTPAVLDPVEIARRSETELRERLSQLDIERLRDIVAQYGMDPGKLVMKWKDAGRVVDRIMELAVARSKKGDAFRAE